MFSATTFYIAVELRVKNIFNSAEMRGMLTQMWPGIIALLALGLTLQIVTEPLPSLLF